MSFQDLGLSSSLVKSIESIGFTNPTEIQQKAIPVLLQNKTDMIGLAQTGTGKTAAFGLPILEKIDPKSKKVQALVLCPTRELCVQISAEINKYGAKFDRFSCVSVYGGAAIDRQITQLKRGAQIVVGTPGRTLDLINRGALDLSTVEMVVLDEADEMLNMGFQEDLTAILEHTRSDKSTWLFSATMPEGVERIAKRFMHEPTRVSVGHKNSSAQNIEHKYTVVRSTDMFEALRRFIDFYPNFFGIVFCRTRRNAKEISHQLTAAGYDADALHGDLSQAQRDHVMRKFRAQQLQVLVATDVAARGIDVSNVTHVIHYGLPEDIENYTHRSGRTARAGKSGVSLAVCHLRDARRIRSFEQQIRAEISYVPVPGAKEIAEQQIDNFVKTFHEATVDADVVDKFGNKIVDALSQLSKDDLINRLVSLELKRYANYGADTSRINIDPKNTRSARDRGARERGGSSSRLFINIGSVDGLDKKSFVNFVCKAAKINSRDIGDITLKKSFTFFNINESRVAEIILRSLKGKSHKGRRIRVEASSAGPRSRRRR